MDSFSMANAMCLPIIVAGLRLNWMNVFLVEALEIALENVYKQVN